MTASEICSFTWTAHTYTLILLHEKGRNTEFFLVLSFRPFIRTEYEDLLRNTKIYYLETFYAVILYHN